MVGIPLDDPAGVARIIFGHDHWSKAAEILKDIFQPHARVAVKGCNASSKTYSAADAIVLTLLTGGDVLITAPTGDQVEGILWRQVKQTIQDCKIDTSDWEVMQGIIRTPTGETATARSTDQGVRFQGYHARPDAPLLIVVDEAPGVIGEIMEAIGGISAGGDVRLVLMGNPIVPQGAYFDIFDKDLPNWTKHTISALENPNLEGITLDALLEMSDEELDQNVRPYLSTRRWVKEQYLTHGPSSAYWFSHVLGEFPPDDTEGLIGRTYLDAAREVPGGTDSYILPSQGGEPLVAGIDVAGPGEDETVIALRQGRVLLGLWATTIPDSRQWARDLLLPWVERGLAQINVDEIGQGWYFLRDLEDHFGSASGLHVRVVGVNVQKKPLTPESQRKFSNLKGALYWQLRERFRNGEIGGVTDEVLRSQLASLQYREDRFGRIVMESKDQLKRRGQKSPDRAEAVMLCYASGPGEGAGLGQHERMRVGFGRGAHFVRGRSNKTQAPSPRQGLQAFQRRSR